MFREYLKKDLKQYVITLQCRLWWRQNNLPLMAFEGVNMRFEAEKGGISVNDFLKEKRFSRRLISRLKFENAILVNDAPVWTNYILSAGDIVGVKFSEKQSENIVPQDIELEILYEDKHLLAVNKPHNTAIHPSHGHSENTLANAVMGYYEKSGIKTAIRIAGRLDLDTTGVVLISKDALTSKILSETVIDKYYTAIVCGKLPEKGVINANIKDLQEGMKRIISDDGKTAVTEYERLEYRNGYSLAGVKILTGRTHQIRLHMSHIGYPIVGDMLYGSDMSMPRQALHAARLEFIHPIFEKKISISADMPMDMKEFWNRKAE